MNSSRPATRPKRSAYGTPINTNPIVQSTPTRRQASSAARMYAASASLMSSNNSEPPARKGQENLPAERPAVLQQKERHDGNQNEPRQIAQERQQAAEAVTQTISRRVGGASICA